VANAARALGMNVIGFDPGISVKSAWNLSADVQACSSVDDMMTQVDFISLHVPLIDATKNLINEDRLAKMKAGGVVMNFARDGIVDDEAAIREMLQLALKMAGYECLEAENAQQAKTLALNE